VYDKEAEFYDKNDEGAASAAQHKGKKEKPVFLRDYQREKIMRGDVGQSDDEDEALPPATRTFAQEQDALKKSIVSQMHASGSEQESDSDSDGGDFMKRKEPAKADANGVHPSRAQGLKRVEVDVENADRDPENFLSNFLASRAWVPEEGSRWKAFESDEGEDDDDRADAFEEAYNMRFENPEKSNEVLKSYARDVAAARSVRRDDKSGRKRKRELEKEQKEAEKRERREEKARLRKLKLEEAEEKLRKLKQAAGSTGRELRDEDWMKFLDDAWDDDQWEAEMNKRFGDEYYAQDDVENVAGSDDEDGSAAAKKSKKKHPKKPTWDDDIDIKDIVPDFDEGEGKPNITLSDDDEAQEDGGAKVEGEEEEEADDDDESAPAPKRRKKADHKRARLESQKQARRDRAKLEALVDSKLELTNHDLLSSKPSSSSASAPSFRYRETSPQAFGMTSRDILLAPSDAALNDFAGLKKLAAFRDEEKKRKDRKRLGKKARLRQWRRDHFGKDYEAEGPTYGFEKFASENGDANNRGESTAATESNVVEGSRSRKRSKAK
jgi:protein KRI1